MQRAAPWGVALCHCPLKRSPAHTRKFSDMEDWELEFEWLRLRHYIKKAFGRDALPDLNAVLFLIGVQELGFWKHPFTKEEKQDLMHIAVCRLLSYDGYFAFEGRDEDGWPHYRNLRPVHVASLEAQERLLKEKAIQYFRELEADYRHALEEE